MDKRKIAGIILLIFVLLEKSFAQYPNVPDSIQTAASSMMAAAYAHSDSMWQQAWPTIQQEANQGRPFIPWARRPYDLPQAAIPAFPGAEGGGMYTLGGRGGKVIIVTSLADSGPGSLREACETGGARIVVFNVAGIIRLKTPIMVKAPYITIAGQTAPGDGVCVAGESFWIDTHDVIIRHMRFRRGETNVGRRDDAIGGNPIGNIMIDHVSASWGLDENMSMYRHMYDDGTGKKELEKLPTVNITIQNSIFSEALDTWNHSFGSTLGGENGSFMRNLWANNTGRNPSIGWFGIFNFVNNVVFNWMHRSIDGGDYRAMYNIVNNYFKPGPVTNLNSPLSHRILKPESGRSKLDHLEFGRAYVSGNYIENNHRVSADNWDGGGQIEDMPNAGAYRDQIKWDQPLPMPEMTILDAKSAYKYVLENAGATMPRRDAVDERIIRVVQTGKIEYAPDARPIAQFKHRRLPEDSYKMGIITDINQVGGYPDYKGTPRKDSDKDGMPDEWEIKYAKLGLDPHNPADAPKDCNGDGYTNIEKYINGIDPTQYKDWSNPLNNHDTLLPADLNN